MKANELNAQFQYVLDCINNDEETLTTPEEKLNYFKECFDAEYNSPHERRTYPNLQKRIEQYLRGLPGCCKIEFWDYDIIQIGKSWGYCRTERKAAEFAERWWGRIAMRIMQLCRRYGIELN